MTETQVRALLKKRVNEYTLKKAAAADIGCSLQHLSNVMSDRTKKKPGTKILKFLRLKEVRATTVKYMEIG